MARAVSVLLAAATLTFAGAAQAAPANAPRTTTTNALTRLLNDTAALRATDARAAVRRQLAARANQALRYAFTRPCRSVAWMERYRALVPRVAERPTAPETNRPGPASIRGVLDRDALAVDAGLKQLPNTRRCGGGGRTRAGTALTTKVGRSTKRVLRMHVTLPVARWDARRGGGQDFIGLNMDGTDAIGGIGDPGVPAFTKLFAVPRGARMSVRVSNARGYTLDGIDLFPKQEQAVDQAPPPEPTAETFADKPFKIDRRAFRGRRAIPRRLAFARILGQMRDVRVGAVQVPGAQYDPRTRRARIFTSMDVTVTFRRPRAWVPRRVRTAFEKPFASLFRSTLANAKQVTRATPKATAAQTAACGEDYLIVTSPTLRPAADTMAATKAAQGMRVTVHEVAPGTPAGDVRTFIRGELNTTTCTRPTYALIVGDTSHVPSFTEMFCADPANCSVTSDLSYSLNGVGSDAFADVMLGRIPANTLSVAQSTIDKIVTYETQLPAPPGDDFYNHATVTSFFEGPGPQDQRGFTLSAERMRAGLRSRGHVVTRLNSALSTADIQRFKDGTPIPDELKRPNTTWTDTSTQVINELNAGRFLFVHRDHGSHYGWANPGFSYTQVDQLNNGTKLPVIFAINCASGSFQFPGNPSVNELLLQRAGGGAVAVIADTENSPTVQNDQLTVGWADALFPATVPAFGTDTPLTRMGEVLNAGKAYMSSLAAASQQLTGNVYKEMLIWHVLGDPSMEIRTAAPQRFSSKNIARFEHRRDSYPVGDPSFQVRVTSGQAGTDGTVATLLHGTEPIGRATVSGGTALITPTKRTDSANLSVALERDNFISTTLPVSAPVPTLTITCPAEVNVPTEDNAQIQGRVSPAVSGATVGFKVTRPNGTVTTHTTTTNASSTFAIKIPMSNSDIGNVTIQAFYDGALKYGADDASCVVPVF